MIDTWLSCRFDNLTCVNVIRGGCANRSYENFVLMRGCHAGLVACYMYNLFGVAMPIEGNRSCENFILIYSWQAGLAPCTLCSG